MLLKLLGEFIFIMSSAYFGAFFYHLIHRKATERQNFERFEKYIEEKERQVRELEKREMQCCK